MSIIERAEHQPNAWTCGPAALRNAMLAHEYVADVRDLDRQSESDCCEKGPRYGRCEHGLANAAREHGFQLRHGVCRSAAEAYVFMREFLATAPILICVDHYSHWITALRATSRHVWIVDPARDEELHQKLTVRRVMQRLAFGLPDDVVFHLYPLVMR